MQKNNTSGFPGVTWNKERQKWRAAIQTHKRRVLLGEFDDPEEAEKAYKLAKKILALAVKETARRLQAAASEAKAILAGTDIGSLPNDITLRRVAEARIEDLSVLRGQRDEYLSDVVRMRAEIERLQAALHAARDALKYGIAPAARHEAVSIIDDALSGKGES